MNGLFSRPAIVLLVAAGVALFALSILLHAYDDDPVSTRSEADPGTYSLSAIGHAGLYDALRRLGFPVSRSAGNTLAAVGGRGLLVVAEPDPRGMSSEDGAKLLFAPRLLLVLPKWRGVRDKNRPAWLSEAAPVYLARARNTLHLVSAQSDVYRDVWPDAWETNALGIAPANPGNGAAVQLIRSRALRPVVGDEQGMLVGELASENRTIWILADPDVMANHGIGEGGNFPFMLALLDALRMKRNSDPGAPIVFDETVHGFQAPQGSPVTLFFRFPFAVVALLAAASGAIAVVAGMSRFGAPRPPEPVLDFGTAALIANSARMLDYAGHHAAVLKRYVLMLVRLAADGLHAPRGMDPSSLAVWFGKTEKARGVTTSCSAIVRSVAVINDREPKNLPRLLACARDGYHWKGEILNGHGTASRRR